MQKQEPARSPLCLTDREKSLRAACFLAAVLLREFGDGLDGFPHARFVDLVNLEQIADSVEHRQRQPATQVLSLPSSRCARARIW